MATNIINEPAKHSNQIRTANKSVSETILFGADRVFIGTENKNETEIAQDENGIKYERNKIEATEIYNLNKQAHHCWFMLDLETGGRGWYPGAKEVVDISNATIYAENTDQSSVLEEGVSGTYDKLDLLYGTTTDSTGKIVYCKIQFKSNLVGYLKNSYVIKSYFIDRT